MKKARRERRALGKINGEILVEIPIKQKIRLIHPLFLEVRLLLLCLMLHIYFKCLIFHYASRS